MANKGIVLTRLMMLLAIAALPVVVKASGIEKEYQKLIRKYDVPAEARWVKEHSPEDFWKTAIDSDRELAKFDRDIKKDRGAEREALSKESALPHFYPEYDQYVVAGLQGYCDSLLTDMGIKDISADCSFHIVNSDNPNLFSALTDNGFAICVTKALYDNEKMTDDIMKGYVAQEYAHGVLRHRLRSLYADARQKRKDQIIGGIMLGVVVTAAGALDAVVDDDTPVVYTVPLYEDMPARPAGDNIDDGKEILQNLKDSLKKNTLVYSFNFTPGQVYEADLMSYRFLENIGAPDAFFDGLKILGARYDAQFTTLPDHPSIQQRINFMEYVKENPGYTRD